MYKTSGINTENGKLKFLMNLQSKTDEKVGKENFQSNDRRILKSIIDEYKR